MITFKQENNNQSGTQKIQKKIADNKHNLLWFEAAIDIKEHQKRFLSFDIKEIKGQYQCIALSNPTEVIIVGGSSRAGQVQVCDGSLLATAKFTIAGGSSRDCEVVAIDGSLLVTGKFTQG